MVVPKVTVWEFGAIKVAEMADACLETRHQVLGSVQDLERIFGSKPLEEPLIAFEDLSDGQLAQVGVFAQERNLTVRRFLIQMNEFGYPLA